MTQAPNIALKITLAQINPIVGNLSYNMDKIRATWKDVPQDTDLIIFPEMIICGYPPEDLVLKPFFMDSVEQAIKALVDESKNHNAALLLSTPWRIDGKTYNAIHLVHKGKILATRTKRHLPNYGVFDEQRLFTPGPLPEPMEFKDIQLGVMVCEDMWHSDSAGYLKQKGAEILIVINASPFDSKKHDIRLHLAQARTDETGLPLLYVNQVGGQDELVFDGGSFVLDDKGIQKIRFPEFEERLDTITFKKNDNGIAFTGDQNLPPPLREHESIYRAVALGLHDYIEKNNFPGVLLGLSGGIDSALSAAIAVDALGPERVHCVMMPSRYTSQDSLDDAKEQADALGIKLDTIPIEPVVEQFNTIMSDHKDSSVTFENIQSRTRAVILMGLSNATEKMVLSTGNKSEMAVGYATLYGDMCGGFNALKDIYKTQVYELARWRNEQGQVIPERVIAKIPTAELKDNQSDQDTLPPYETLDDILMCLIEQDMSINDIAKRGHGREMVEKIWQMLGRAEYKRWQSPPGIKITSRAFGRDRRYPITNHFVNLIEKSGI
ncbi:MAG: NAD+ synthase [Micavibrio sp.]|nr:MAG: NAD+ synthase [Micavibrio sp.]